MAEWKDDRGRSIEGGLRHMHADDSQTGTPGTAHIRGPALLPTQRAGLLPKGPLHCCDATNKNNPTSSRPPPLLLTSTGSC